MNSDGCQVIYDKEIRVEGDIGKRLTAIHLMGKCEPDIYLTIRRRYGKVFGSKYLRIYKYNCTMMIPRQIDLSGMVKIRLDLKHGLVI